MEAVEWSFIHKFSIPCFPMQAIDRVGIVNAVESALNMVDPLKVFTGAIKGTVSTVSSQPSLQNSNARFTTVPLKVLSDQA